MGSLQRTKHQGVHRMLLYFLKHKKIHKLKIIIDHINYYIILLYIIINNILRPYKYAWSGPYRCRMECCACISVQMLPWPQTLLLPCYIQLQHFKNSDTFSFNVCWVKWRLERRMNDTHTAKNIRLTSNTKLQTLHSPSLKYWTAQELFFLSASPPSETTSVTTRWRPPRLRTSNNRSPSPI